LNCRKGAHDGGIVTRSEGVEEAEEAEEVEDGEEDCSEEV